MSKKEKRTNEILQRAAVRLDERAIVLTEENAALKAQLAKAEAPAVAAPAPTPPPPTLRQQYRAMTDPMQKAMFLLTNEQALLAEADGERRK